MTAAFETATARQPADGDESKLQTATFSREDWTLFRTLETLCQKAGVHRTKLGRLVVKELVDNALDAANRCYFGVLPEGGFYVSNGGAGIEPERLPTLFSIRRPLISSKLLRLPTRGALGNGLRVVSGAVLASAGTLCVETRGARWQLIPRDDGSTEARRLGDSARAGLRVEVVLGGDLGDDAHILHWAARAAVLGEDSHLTSYAGKSSPHWYDADSFFELCQASGDLSARALVERLEGCSGAKAGQIAATFRNRLATSLSRAEATALLGAARAQSRPVKADRLGAVGRRAVLPSGYAKETGTFRIHQGRGPAAELPFVVEAWAEPAEADCESFRAHVNRTPVTADVTTWHEKSEQTIHGCGLHFEVKTGRRPSSIWLNVTSPHIAITSDGKSPDFDRPALREAIWRAVERAVGSGKRASASANGDDRPLTQSDVVLEALPAAVERLRAGGHRFAQRQLFYAVRPAVLKALEKNLDYDWFCKLITQHEDATGEDIPGMFRDPRGTLYHPHQRRDIALGTIAVESYARPAWTFNKVLYIEKEGFFENLKAIGWPERRDCALLTAKGFASRAVKDLLDKLGDDDEPVTVFCVHDADGPGTMIYQTLVEETKARAKRRVEVINLGLEADEALEMGLDVETFPEREKRTAVADYVSAERAQWYQTRRVELNAMTTAQFIAWLDRKVDEHDAGKVVPPAPVIIKHMHEHASEALRERITEKILREADCDAQVAAAVAAVAPRIDACANDVTADVADSLAEDPTQHWTDAADELANDLLERAG